MEPKKCEHCREGEYIVRVKKYWHRITPGLIRTLAKVYGKVNEKNENIVFMNELDLDHSEYGNFQKLRFHALIAKLRKSGEVIHRAWVITHRGAQFLRGEISIPKRVQTLMNKVVAHDTEMIDITRAMQQEPDWETYEDFKNQLPIVEFAEPEDDIDSLKPVTTKKRRGKKYCLKCGGEMKIAYYFNAIELVKEEPARPGAFLEIKYPSYKVKKVYKCPVCGLEEEIK